MRSAAFGSHTCLRWDSQPLIFDCPKHPTPNYLSYVWIFFHEQSRKMKHLLFLVTQVLLGMISLWLFIPSHHSNRAVLDGKQETMLNDNVLLNNVIVWCGHRRTNLWVRRLLLASASDQAFDNGVPRFCRWSKGKCFLGPRKSESICK